MEQPDLFTETEDKSLLSAFGWWEKRRIVYNIVVGLTGIFCIFYMTVPVHWLEILAYGFLANLCYSLGFFIEVAVRYYFKSKADFTVRRNILFGAGLVISILVTFVLSVAYDFIMMPIFG